MPASIDGGHNISTQWESKGQIKYNNAGVAAHSISRDEDSVNRISMSKSSFKNMGNKQRNQSNESQESNDSFERLNTGSSRNKFFANTRVKSQNNKRIIMREAHQEYMGG